MKVREIAFWAVKWLPAVFLCAAALAGFAQDAVVRAPRPAVVVYFSNPASEGVWQAVEDAFAKEQAQHGGELMLPPDLQLVAASSLHLNSEFGRLITVHLQGRCDVAEQAFRPVSRGPLGWVPEVSGEIQPFVYVNCDRLAQYLRPRLLGMNGQQRTSAMGTAITRIMLHEWLHITLQTAEHTSHGIRRAELSANDLIAPVTAMPGN
jgi:hypothetical protein